MREELWRHMNMTTQKGHTVKGQYTLMSLPFHGQSHNRDSSQPYDLWLTLSKLSLVNASLLEHVLHQDPEDEKLPLEFGMAWLKWKCSIHWKLLSRSHNQYCWPALQQLVAETGAMRLTSPALAVCDSNAMLNNGIFFRFLFPELCELFHSVLQ